MLNKKIISESFIYLSIFIFLIIFGNFTKNETKIFLKYTSSQAGLGQIFYANGDGFSEVKSIKYEVKIGENIKIISLPNFKIVDLRLDLIDKANVDIELKNMVLLKNKEQTRLNIARLSGINELKKEKNYQTITGDPIIFLKKIDIIPSSKINYTLLGICFIVLSLFYKYRKYMLKNKKILAIFFLVLFINIFRSSDAILTPIIYSEDGVWISDIINKGLINTLLNARKDYFVMGNILLLYVAYFFNKISNFGLIELPYFVAIVSYLFYTISYTYIWLILNKIIKNTFVKICLLLMILFIPFGNSFNELMGRISNIGYIIPVLLLVAIVSYENNIERKGIYIYGVIGVLTNPISFIYLGIYFVYRLFKAENHFKEIYSFWLLKLISLISFISIIYRYSKVGNTATLTSEKFIKESVIELILARSLFYPYIFSIYSNLSDMSIVIIFILIIIFITFVLKKIDIKSRVLIFQVFLGWIIYSFMALLMRPGLTNWIKGYSNTFPDRYFYAQNLLAIILFTIIVDKSLKNSLTELIGKTILIGIIVLYLSNLLSLIEFNNPKLNFGKKTFEESLIEKLRFENEKNDITIPIIPNGWQMNIPLDKIEL